MAHEHEMNGNVLFSIDAVAKAITKQTAEEITLIQNEHNAKRFVFTLPRYVEGHDMTLCNKIEAHFINIDTKTREESKDISEIDDLRITEDSGDFVECSWLIPQTATLFSGTLAFALRFACLEGSTVNYQIFTDPFEGISISGTIFNSESIDADYSDMLAKWKEELTAAANSLPFEKIEPAIEQYFAENPIDVDGVITCKPQELTAEEQEQARANIDALGSENLQEAVNLALSQAKESGEFNGEPGETPEKGVDYWTEEDKAEMVEAVLASIPLAEGVAY